MEPSAPPPLHLRLRHLSELTEEEGNLHILKQRKSNGVVKGDAQGRVRIFTARSAVEEVLLDVLENWEERAAFLITDDVPIRAGNTADEGSCDNGHYLWCCLSDE